MKKHLNPLEKEFLIRRYFNNPDVSLKSFCEANNVSTSSFRKWRSLYSRFGIEGLAKDDKNLAPLLPPEVNPTLEMYKVEFDNAESQHIRIFFNWDKTKTLKQNLEILNAFERIQITEMDGTLKVE